MLNTLVKPNDIIEREPRNILESHHSQGKKVVCPEDFLILANSSCNFKLEIQESILIKLLKPTLNKNISSVPLPLF